MHGVGGDRMVRSWSDMNQGSRAEKERRSWLLREPEEPCPEGDRTSVVAKKRSNARGAKGGRKVEILNKRRREANTVNVHWTQFGEEQRPLQTFRWSQVSVGRLGNERQPRIEPERSMDALADLLWSQPPTGEPDAGNLPVRFGGRGEADLCPYPYLSTGGRRDRF